MSCLLDNANPAMRTRAQRASDTRQKQVSAEPCCLESHVDYGFAWIRDMEATQTAALAAPISAKEDPDNLSIYAGIMCK
ncbi:hypothetical protein PtA15_11A11 [Puccinia triticina]|uniref:Uncharacterized protein n=1 Tax=Puccinia triticina TaxID=208348 RepID=A0ABY7CVI9_9BASI|nr:uncharacterized protein PtA15_11A11 [Puccinia triticina]WAQ89324.1 hypothetical protein PtA15_11A11 [Puccinia triticina]WAR59371.1 hypothetical protein PtB15_11B11 [Puccinia triticina]